MSFKIYRQLFKRYKLEMAFTRAEMSMVPFADLVVVAAGLPAVTSLQIRALEHRQDMHFAVA